MPRQIIDKICEVCSKPFSLSSKYGLKKIAQRKYCSLDCYHKTDNYQKGIYKKGHEGLAFEKNPAWKGGKHIDKSNGYIRVSIGKKKSRHEHRLVMEKHLSRPLSKIEQVHHLDGNKTNNDIANLFLCTNGSEHIKLFHKDHYKNLSFNKT